MSRSYEYRFTCTRELGDKITARIAALGVSRSEVYIGFSNYFLEETESLLEENTEESQDSKVNSSAQELSSHSSSSQSLPSYVDSAIYIDTSKSARGL